ncbi:MAG: ABC transporter substrate-binding protein [Aminipila sp.]
MLKKIIIIVSIILVLGAAFWYFQKGEGFVNPFDKSDEVKINYSDSNTVNLPMEKVRTLNPVTSKDIDTYRISSLVFESLFYLDEKLALVNGLASSYNYDMDKSSVDIRIRPDSYFSNGENVTASDVKFSIENYISAAASGNTIYGNYVSNIKSVNLDKSDRYSLTINFRDKRDISLENFIFPIVSQKNFGKYQASKVTSSKFAPIGSGPYAIDKYNEISGLTLVANKYYSGTKPTNNLNFTILPEKKDVIPLLEVNNISIGFLEELSRDTLISDKKISITNFASNELEVIGYNFTREAMANKKLRKAIAYSINNQELNELAYYKNGMMSDTLFFPGYLGTENTGDNYKYNLEKAKSLLTSANYLDRDENGYLEDESDSELNIDILVDGSDKSRVLVAEALKSSLDKLSVSCKIIYASDNQDFLDKVRGKDYDVFIGGMQINETYDLRSLLHSDYSNIIGYSNGKLDILLDRLKSGISSEQKVQTVNEIKEILIDELPYYCIIYKTYGALSSQCIAGDNKIYMFNNIYNGCESWYCKYPIKETPQVVVSNGAEDITEKSE